MIEEAMYQQIGDPHKHSLFLTWDIADIWHFSFLTKGRKWKNAGGRGGG